MSRSDYSVEKREPMAVAEHRHHEHRATTPDGTVRDPVCGMTVDAANSKHRAEHDGVPYHFCSARCREKFVADPDKYLKPPRSDAPKPAPKPGVIYTCPMHPQIRQPQSGNCPICGMALEPEGVAEEIGPNPELVDMTRRFWLGAILSVPLLVLEMGTHFPGLNLHQYVPPQVSVWVQFLLGTPVVLWCGWPFFERGWASLKNRSLNMFTLIAFGVGRRPPG
jgi:P-type Cu+ transporter